MFVFSKPNGTRSCLKFSMVQPEDVEQAVPRAHWVHHLRTLMLQAPGPTLFPAPLHLAQLMEEYMVC